jgi:hypothetical protein
VTIKIRTKSGKWLTAKAFPTSHPKLFITPERERGLRPDLRPMKRGRFSRYEFTITHRPSGYSIVPWPLELDAARRLGELFAKSKIPWEKLRSKRDALRYGRQHAAVMKNFLKIPR